MTPLAELHRALEVAHYARRHRDGTIVLALGAGVVVADVLLDLKLMHAHGVRAVVVTTAEDAHDDLVDHARAEGIPLRPLFAEAEAPCREALSAGELPIIGAVDTKAPVGPTEAIAVRLARSLGARRLFLVRPVTEPPLSPHPHLTVPEVAALLPDPDLAPLWRLVVDQVSDETGLPGVVLVTGQPGFIFAELFTHQGAGLLVGDPIEDHIRPARIADTPDLELLLRAEVARGVLRPIPDHDVALTAHQHLVYTIDGFVVATARLRPYGTWAEMSRFATLPRYRGRGRARQLGEALIERAREMGYEGLFALSIDARMWRFFESLGLTVTAREALPAEWQAQYDFCRPSRAYQLRL